MHPGKMGNEEAWQAVTPRQGGGTGIAREKSASARKRKPSRAGS